jgi:hypothetical protein
MMNHFTWSKPFKGEVEEGSISLMNLHNQNSDED